MSRNLSEKSNVPIYTKTVPLVNDVWTIRTFGFRTETKNFFCFQIVTRYCFSFLGNSKIGTGKNIVEL